MYQLKKDPMTIPMNMKTSGTRTALEICIMTVVIAKRICTHHHIKEDATMIM